MAWPFRRKPEPVTAAAVPYTSTATVPLGTAAVKTSRPREWQREAFDYLDLNWLVDKGLEVHANLVARNRLYVGLVVGDDEERPIEVMAEATRKVEPEPDGTPGRPNALTVEQAQVAIDELDRIQASQGGQAAILHDLDLNIQAVGECNLVGFPVDDPLGIVDEDWTVLSVEEFRTGPGGRYERLGRTGRWERMPDDTFAYRVWKSHPRRSYEPRAPLRSLLTNLTTLNISELMVQAQMRSRTSAGLQFFPQEALAGPPDPTRAETDGQTEDPTIAAMNEAALDAISDPGDPANVARTIITMPAEMITPAVEGIVELDRPLDKVAIELRAEAKTAIIEGLPLPPEVIAGLGSSTYRNAEQITQNTYDQHVKPDIDFLTGSLTSGVLRRAWVLAGIPVELARRLVVASDPADLIANPDRMQNSKDAFAEYLVSEEVRRRDLGYSSADAPDEDEITARLTRERILRSRIDPTVPTPDAVEGAPPEGQPSEPVVAALSDRASRLAAAGRRQADLDRALALRLLVAADAEMAAVLTRAGNRALASMPRSQTASVRGVPRDALVAALGPDGVGGLGMTDAELLDGAFAGLRERWDTWTRAYYAQALRIAAGVTGMSVADQERHLEESQAARDAGWAVFSAALLALAKDRLYDPHPAAPPLGEHDPGLRVSPAVVRQALAVAGGEREPQVTTAGGVLSADGEPVGGVATGPDIAAIFAEHGVVTSGWVWEHGDPATPFEPHEALDGTEFESWRDDSLIPPPEADWLGVDRMFPGDHLWDSCTFYRLLSDADDNEDEESA